MSKEKIKQIFDSIEDTNTYIGDSAIRTLAAIAFYEVEQEKNVELDYNDIIDYIGVDSIDIACKTIQPENFQPFDVVYKNYKHDIAYQEFINYFKSKTEEYLNENIIKRTCRKLRLTYRELGQAIGYSEGSIKKIASTGEISPQIQKAVELYVKNIELERELEEIKTLKKLLKKFFS